MKPSPLAVQHVMDWRSAQAFFAIVRGTEIVRRLNASSWREAGVALRQYKREHAR